MIEGGERTKEREGEERRDLDEGAEVFAVVVVEFLLDVLHVHLTAGHHHPHQRTVIRSQTLSTHTHTHTHTHTQSSSGSGMERV